jgi:hypothetical protein
MLKTIAKIEGHPDLIRDVSSGAIVNNATEEYQKFIEKKNKEKNILKRVEALENNVMDIKNSLKDINQSFIELVLLIKNGK